MSQMNFGKQTSTQPDACLGAALSLYETKGLNAITLRSIAEQSGVPIATVQRRFETKERLLNEVMTAFVAEEQMRMRRLRESIGESAMPIESVPYVIGAHVDAPGERLKRVMLIEMLVAAVRDPNLRALAKTWLTIAETTWAFIMGEEPGSPLSRFIVEVEVAIILDSIGCDESLGLRLANIEIAEIALLNRPQPNHYWFQVLLKNAITSNDPLTRGDITSENRQRILAAGSEMLIGQGADEVTFRSVAAKAGITFSAVASLYRRREVLLASICNFMVMRAITVAPPPPGTRDLAWVCEVACDMLTGEGSFAGEFFFMGSVELRLLAARDSLASGLVRRLRVMNGLYEQRKDDPDYDPFGATAFAVHARQLWAQGAALILGATGSHEGLRPALLERLSAEAPRFELGEFRRAIVRSPL